MTASMLLLPLLSMLLIGFFILLLLVRGLLHILSDANDPGDTMSRDEAALIQEIYRTLERLEQRIEPLEDRLFARERTARHRD